MEEKSTLLKVTSRQRDMDGAQLENTEIYRAKVYGGEETALCYEIQGDPVKMVIREGRVEIIREGTLKMRLCIEAGRTHRGIYATPYGEMDVAVKGTRVLTAREGARCTVRMEYEVLLDGQTVYANDVSVVYRR